MHLLTLVMIGGHFQSNGVKEMSRPLFLIIVSCSMRMAMQRNGQPAASCTCPSACLFGLLLLMMSYQCTAFRFACIRARGSKHPCRYFSSLYRARYEWHAKEWAASSILHMSVTTVVRDAQSVTTAMCVTTVRHAPPFTMAHVLRHDGARCAARHDGECA